LICNVIWWLLNNITHNIWLKLFFLIIKIINYWNCSVLFEFHDIFVASKNWISVLYTIFWRIWKHGKLLIVDVQFHPSPKCMAVRQFWLNEQQIHCGVLMSVGENWCTSGYVTETQVVLMTVEVSQPHHSRIYEVTCTAAFTLGERYIIYFLLSELIFKYQSFCSREHVVLCKCVFPLRCTCLAACLLVAFPLSLRDCIPASPCIKLTWFLSSMKGGFHGLRK
jgi:hypothetical protein